MNPLYKFILTLFQHGYKVRYSTLLHLLNGKRTGSILIYGFFYDNLPYLGLYPELTDREFKKILANLVQQELLEISGEQRQFVQLTDVGHNFLAQSPSRNFKEINSFLYSRLDEEFYDLLIFSSQVVSEMSRKNTQYIPIESNPQKQSMIRFWLTQQGDRSGLAPALYKEWLTFFESLPTEFRDGVSLLLTGHQQIGLTFYQLCQQQGWEYDLAYLYRKDYLHQLLTKIRAEEEIFPIFNSLLHLIRQPLSNQSALASIQLFLEGNSLTSISQKRQLKESTVSDHLLEGAIMLADFPSDRLLSSTSEAELNNYLKVAPDFRNWHYQSCQAQIPSLSFLEFRLAQILSVRREAK